MTNFAHSNIDLDEDLDDADRECRPLTGTLTWGVRCRGSDGKVRPSEQEEMFWTSLSGVNDNEA